MVASLIRGLIVIVQACRGKNDSSGADKVTPLSDDTKRGAWTFNEKGEKIKYGSQITEKEMMDDPSARNMAYPTPRNDNENTFIEEADNIEVKQGAKIRKSAMPMVNF